jgi:hypothetical protein
VEEEFQGAKKKGSPIASNLVKTISEKNAKVT